MFRSVSRIHLLKTREKLVEFFKPVEKNSTFKLNNLFRPTWSKRAHIITNMFLNEIHILHNTIIISFIFFTSIWSIPTKVMHICKKTTLLHSPEFFSLYRRHMELSQKIYASSYYMIVAT